MTEKDNREQPTPLEVEFFVNAEPVTIDAEEQDQLEALTSFVLTNEGASGLWDITVSLVDDANLQQLHSRFMGSDTPTDVMTFPLEERGGAIQGGDILISIDHARTRAAEWGLTPAEEIRFLVVHGLLHLLGWRDESDEQRKRMLQRQQALIDQFLQTEGDSRLHLLRNRAKPRAENVEERQRR